MKHEGRIRRIRSRMAELKQRSDESLREIGVDLKYDAMVGGKRSRLLTEGFALVGEATRRHLGMEHYDVQFSCGLEMASGRIAEMKTGEGKTITATLAAYLYALGGKGVHVFTFNDYLAKRDLEIAAPVYSALGLSHGVIFDGQTPTERKAIYRKDIIYGTAKEFGFDFLRDRLATFQTGDQSKCVMRGLHCAVVDEADSIMIDEARTPLIIGLLDEAEQKMLEGACRWAAKYAKRFQKKKHYKYDHNLKSITLTPLGKGLIRSLPETNVTRKLSFQQIAFRIKNAIKVKRDFHLDQQYAIMNGEVVIIDEFTGRPAEGRQWQGGLHQAIEAKEGLDISPNTRQAASITLQAFLNRYEKTCGMTGTIYASKREMSKVYQKRVTRIPTHRPSQRIKLATRLFRTCEEKFRAIAEESNQMIRAGRSVLIGNRSVEASELLSKFLTQAGLSHEVLNARNLEQEAEIVELAGQPGRLTVATNMAGRGTDIKLHSTVRDAGGLHVILTELHESQRIDWQLIGRGARQGDPGSFRIYLSFDDDILESGLGPRKSSKLQKRYSKSSSISGSASRYFYLAQRKVERKHLLDRMIILSNDREKRVQHFDSGTDPYLDAVQS